MMSCRHPLSSASIAFIKQGKQSRVHTRTYLALCADHYQPTRWVDKVHELTAPTGLLQSKYKTPLLFTIKIKMHSEICIKTEALCIFLPCGWRHHTCFLIFTHPFL